MSGPRHVPRRVPGLLALLALGACASQPMPAPGHEEGVERAISQPLRDLSLIREVAPDVLLRAAVSPYGAASIKDCGDARAAVAELDAVLGPDLTPNAKSAGFTAEGLAGDLVGGAIGLPFRGVVRMVTGADERDKALRSAILAGMVRRGFLKGRMSAMGCPLPSPPPESAVAEKPAV